MSAGPLIKPADVERIVAMDDQPTLRNLLITQSYHDLSKAMAGLLGQENTNWCTFACWASRTAGRFIRDEEIPAAFRGLVRKENDLGPHRARLDAALAEIHPEAGLDPGHGGILGVADRVIDDVSTYIMAGNKVVYHELGMVFARFIETFDGATEPDPEKLKALVDEYEIGAVLPDVVQLGDGNSFTFQRRGGQSMLRELITLYHQAMFEPDPKRKAELILLGNAQGGLHEQTRLQTYIAGSMDAPIEDLAVGDAHEAVRGQLHDEELLHRAHVAIDRLVHPLAAELRRVWESFSTVAMMEMKLPDVVLRLGEDVPAMPGKPLFPAPLTSISNPELEQALAQYGALAVRSEALDWRERLHALLIRVGLLPKAALGSAATDWVSFSQRMRYIFELFRARQRDPKLFDPPFTAAQRQGILSGKVPEGPLY